jgi:conjugal transfer pilus assembly protein TraV
LKRALVLVLPALLAACAGSPTEERWSCAPARGAFRSCASISEIDARAGATQAARPGVTLQALTGGAPAPAGAASETPVREGETVLRIIVAPWTDAAGDYHARADIFTVVRRGGWVVPVPPPPPPPAPPQPETAP